MITLCLCVPEPEILENGLAPTDTVPQDDDVAVLSAGPPQPDDKDIRKLEIEGQVHPGDENQDQRRRSSSGSSYDSDGEKNEGTYTSPDYADKYKDEEDQRPDDLSSIEERADRERDSYISQPEEKPGYDEPDEKDKDVFPGETDLDAISTNDTTFETNLDDVIDGDKDKPDENFNMAPRSPKRKYQSSSESEPEEEPEKNDEDRKAGKEEGKEDDQFGEPPAAEGEVVDGEERPKSGDVMPQEGKDSDADEKKSKSSSDEEEEKFDDLKNDIDRERPQDDDDETKNEDQEKPGETYV